VSAWSRGRRSSARGEARERGRSRRKGRRGGREERKRRRTLQNRKKLSWLFFLRKLPSPRFADDSIPRGCFGSSPRLYAAASHGELCRGEREGGFISHRRCFFFLLLQCHHARILQLFSLNFSASRVRESSSIVSFLEASQYPYVLQSSASNFKC